MDYVTRSVMLNVIWHYCPNKFGFDDAFEQTTIFFLSEIMNCIINHIPFDRSTYDETVDFLDGNGFKVEGNETNGYVITLA